MSDTLCWCTYEVGGATPTTLRSECPSCNGTDGVGHRLATLANNLAIGAALCRAFWLGGDIYYDTYEWWPGCQREAP